MMMIQLQSLSHILVDPEASILISLPAVHIYDFHILTVKIASVLYRFHLIVIIHCTAVGGLFTFVF